jgi:hypothetical protein
MPIIIGCKSQDGTPTAQAQSAYEMPARITNNCPGVNPRANADTQYAFIFAKG